MTSSRLIPFEEASLKLEELPQAVRLAEQLGDRKLRRGVVWCCMMVKIAIPLVILKQCSYICIFVIP